MEMAMELGDEMALAAEGGLASILERLVVVLERVAAGQVGPIVAAVDSDLERRLGEVEAQIVEMRGSAGFAPDSVTNGRKTLPASMVSLLAKQGVALDSGSMEAGALDSALGSLSVEQRIAVKAQLMRAGLV